MKSKCNRNFLYFLMKFNDNQCTSSWKMCFFLRGEGPPQQMLRTHRSLKAACATPMMKMSSFFYQVLQLMEHQWNEIDRGKPTTRRKTCPSATLSTTNLTWIDPGSNPGLRGERPATSRLSHGMAWKMWLRFSNYTQNSYDSNISRKIPQF
jgi:hypothetical protein